MTTPTSVVVSLPITDRPATMACYAQAFGWQPIGEPESDGVPEPLQYRLDAAVTIFIPTGGFGWVLHGRQIAAPDVTECLLSLTVPDQQHLSNTIEAVRAAGGHVLSEPAQQTWGFSGVSTDLDGHAWQILMADGD